MAIEGSVNAPLVAGLNTINLPADNLTVIGLYPFGLSVGIQLTPGVFAYVPQPNPMVNPQHQIIRVTYKMSSSQLIVNSSSSGNLVVFYGTPLPGSMPLENFKGVSTTVNFAASGATSQTLTITMPKSGGTLVGFIAYENQDTEEYVVTFQTSTGKTVSFYAVPGQLATAADIIALNLPNTAITFPVTVSVSSTAAASSMTFILYYR